MASALHTVAELIASAELEATNGAHEESSRHELVRPQMKRTWASASSFFDHPSSAGMIDDGRLVHAVGLATADSDPLFNSPPVKTKALRRCRVTRRVASHDDASAKVSQLSWLAQEELKDVSFRSNSSSETSFRKRGTEEITKTVLNSSNGASSEAAQDHDVPPTPSTSDVEAFERHAIMPEITPLVERISAADGAMVATRRLAWPTHELVAEAKKTASRQVEQAMQAASRQDEMRAVTEKGKATKEAVKAQHAFQTSSAAMQTAPPQPPRKFFLHSPSAWLVALLFACLICSCVAMSDGEPSAPRNVASRSFASRLVASRPVASFVKSSEVAAEAKEGVTAASTHIFKASTRHRALHTSLAVAGALVPLLLPSLLPALADGVAASVWRLVGRAVGHGTAQAAIPARTVAAARTVAGAAVKTANAAARRARARTVAKAAAKAAAHKAGAARAGATRSMKLTLTASGVVVPRAYMY